MANTYIQIFIQIIFAVKDRNGIIPKNKREELYGYIGGIIKNRNHSVMIINGTHNHIHILISYNPIEPLPELVKEIKRCSSKYINDNKLVIGKFEWQQGYGAFSYSKSQVNKVYEYIKNQESHHKILTFREEYLSFLKKYDIKYNEKYVFDDVKIV